MAQQKDTNPASSLTDLPDEIKSGVQKVKDFFNPPPPKAAEKDPYATPITESAAYKASTASSPQQAQNNRQARVAKKYKSVGGQ